MAGMALSAPAARIGPALQVLLDEPVSERWLALAFRLPEQFDGPTLDQYLLSTGASLAVRHQELMLAMQEHARLAQAPALDWLERQERQARVRRIRPCWLANLIEFDAPAGQIPELARQLGVGWLTTGSVVSLQPRPAAPGICGSGHEWNLELVGAPWLWARAVRGEGRLVAGVDSGVAGGHPSLAARWRGLQPHVSAAHAWLTTGDPSFPFDAATHGTHTMGIMVGASDGDTIGVAPAAQWIAAQIAFTEGPGVSVHAALEWCADPDGDPATFSDVPDAVNNSWGYETFDCVPWDAVEIDNLELLGPVVVFAAGNQGPEAASIIAPANRAAGPATNLAIGAVDATERVAGLSSRGPTRCEVADSLAIKPELVAPGVAIRSAAPAGQFLFYSGTSMAAPHVSGAVALLRQLWPESSAAEIKTLLLQTARHPVVPGGEDNDHGHGVLDLEAAARLLAGRLALFADLEVDLVDAGSGAPLSAGWVDVIGTGLGRPVDAAGRADFELLAGDYEIAASAPTYRPSPPLGVQLHGHERTAIKVQMAARARGQVHGQLRDEEGRPVSAQLSFFDRGEVLPPVSLRSEVDGRFSVDLVAGHYSAEVHPDPPLRFYRIASVLVDSATTVDLSNTIARADVLVMDADGQATAADTLLWLALEAAGRSYNHWDRALRGSAAPFIPTLPTAAALLLHSGDRATDILDAREEEALIDRATSGGRLLLGGSDLVRALAERPLLANTLRVAFRAESSVHELPPCPTSMLGRSLSGPVFTAGYLLPAPQEAQDVIAGGEPALAYAGVDEGAALVTSEPAGGGRAAVAGFALTGVHGEFLGSTSREELLRALLDWLEVTTVVGGEMGPGVGARPRLDCNYPNPFNPRTSIPFDLPTAAHISLRIYDLRGALVAVLVEDELRAGRHLVTWEGRNQAGFNVPSGTYHCRLQSPAGSATRALVLLK